MKITTRILAIPLSLIFVLAAGAKLSSQPDMIESFTRFGMPLWFMYFIGAAELAGAIGIHVQRVRIWALFGLMLIMLGAIGSHLVFDPPQAAAPAVILLVLLGGIWMLDRRMADSSNTHVS